jgi:hypothetical protein
MQEPPDQRRPEGPAKPTAAELKDVILAAIATHLEEYGPHQWALVHDRRDFVHLIGSESGPSDRRPSPREAFRRLCFSQL